MEDEKYIKLMDAYKSLRNQGKRELARKFLLKARALIKEGKVSENAVQTCQYL